MASDLNSASAGTTKTCCMCGTDVSGQKRMKDSLGQYWCIPCADADEKKRHVKKAACPDCGKVLPEDDLVKFELTRVCPKCLRQRRAEHKTIGARHGRLEGAFRKYEIQRVKWMLVIVAVLLGFGLWKFNLVPRFGAGQTPVRQLLWTALVLGIVTLGFLLAGLWWVKKRL